MVQGCGFGEFCIRHQIEKPTNCLCSLIAQTKMMLEIKEMAMFMFLTLSLDISRTSWCMKVSDGCSFGNFMLFHLSPACAEPRIPLQGGREVSDFLNPKFGSQKSALL